MEENFPFLGRIANSLFSGAGMFFVRFQGVYRKKYLWPRDLAQKHSPGKSQGKGPTQSQVRSKGPGRKNPGGLAMEVSLTFI